VLLSCHGSGDKDAEVTNLVVDRVDYGLPVGPDVVDVVIEIKNPMERLLGRSDVVALRAEHHDGRADIAKIDRDAVRGHNPARCQIVADEQLIDDELDLLRVQIDVASLVALKTQIARRLGVDLGIDIILLSPQRVCGVLVLEILHEPGAVELAPSNLPPPRSLVSAVSKLPPRRPPL